jgi:hypothetical protein
MARQRRTPAPRTRSRPRELSAQVIVRPAVPRQRGAGPPTVDNVAEFLPAPDAAQAVQRELTKAGFVVGPLIGNSFSITGPSAAVERFFRVRVRSSAKRGIEAVGKRGTISLELGRGQLPPAVAKFVEAVTFTPPPAFGPTDFAAL